jgi:two-component system sensor histidine kinase YesM
LEKPAPATPGQDADPLATVTTFARPHADGAAPTALAIGKAVPALPLPGGPAGYIIVDLKRQAFAEVLPGAKEAFTELEILDPSSCILFDLNRPYREGSFDEEAAASGSAVLDRASGRIVAGAEVGGGLRLAAYQPITPIEAQLSGLRTASMLAGLFSAVAALILSILLSRSISDPVHRLVQVMGRVEGGDLGARLPVRREDELGALVRSFNRMVSRVQLLVEETIEQHRLLRSAETRALQARIDPHFLYNTLNSIKSIARLRGVDEIAVIATRLGRLLRAGFAVEDEFSSLEEDLDLARSYLEIQAIRYPGRFSFELEAESAVLGVPVPRLAIQPIVENAVVHGLEKRTVPGRLWVRARRVGEDVLVEVEDDGVGMDDDRLVQLKEALRAGERYTAPGKTSATSDESAGIALANTHRRLRLLFGRRYGLEIESREGGGVRTTIRVPFKGEGGTSC